MRILITGAAGNLGSHLARRLAPGPHDLVLLAHRREIPFDTSAYLNIEVRKGDLDRPETLPAVVEGVDCVVHFAGVLFAPLPERFLPRTNTGYARSLVDASVRAGVKKFILVSFPHVEGESTPTRPAIGSLDSAPESVHARTRLAAERYLFEACGNAALVPVALRPGMIYGRDVLMIDAAKWLLARRLLAVWREPTWIHPLALPDFLTCVIAAIEKPVSGVYNLGDDLPTTLQEFLDTLASHWRFPPPWRLPRWTFFLAAGGCETFAWLFRCRSPLTGDFIRIGMASYVSDTSRMKQDLLPKLAYPDLASGLVLL